MDVIPPLLSFIWIWHGPQWKDYVVLCVIVFFVSGPPALVFVALAPVIIVVRQAYKRRRSAEIDAELARMRSSADEA